MRIEVYNIPLEVGFEYVKAERGRRDGYGLPLEPDYPAHIEVNHVETMGGDDITDLLEHKVMDEIEKQIMGSLYENI